MKFYVLFIDAYPDRIRGLPGYDNLIVSSIPHPDCK
jgi:hypothetical protein